MKNLTKFTKKALTLLIAAVIMLGSMGNVNAAAETIQLGPATQTGTYIAGVSFSYKNTVGGDYLYCLNMAKKTAQNTSATLVRNSKYVDGGLVYILKNGYPNKSITGDKDKDYYITQTAVWWYLDLTRGSLNLGDQFKEHGSDNYNLRHYVKDLAYAGYNHRNDKVTPSYNTTINATIADTTLSLHDGYYVSQDVKVSTSSDVSAYKVAVTNAPEGTVVVSSTGATNPASLKAGETFKIKVPANKVNSGNLSLNVKVSATGAAGYAAYEYQPADKEMQNVALLEKIQKTVSKDLTLTIASTKVTITKVDGNTGKAVAGAELVLKDANGTVITSWTSTTSGHIIKDLKNGTYTVEETKAPEGYVKSNEKVKFTIDDANRDVKVTFKNKAKQVVINITKVDQETRTQLPGAVLVIKDSTGKELTRFTTTDKPYVLLNIDYGTYTVEEISAPAGYIKSDQVITFTVDDDHMSHQIVFVNAKEVIVPDTASTASIIMIILGIGITGLGIKYIVKNGKKA